MPFPVVAKDMPTLPPMQINLGSPSNTEEVHYFFDEDQVGDDEEQEEETNLMTVAWLDLHERGTASAVIRQEKKKLNPILVLVIPAKQRSTALHQATEFMWRGMLSIPPWCFFQCF